MQLPRIKSVPTLPIAIPGRRRSSHRRESEPAREASTQSPHGSPGRQPLSLPSASHLDMVRETTTPIAMQISLSALRLPPTHPTKVAANVLALTKSFDSAPEDLDRDPAKYHSALSGKLHAYQTLNAQILQRVAKEPRIIGFGYWVSDMCHARIKSPQTQRPHAENLARRLFELIVALYLVAETDADTIIDVGCDFTKRNSPCADIPRSSDIEVVNPKTRAVRHIEVTSVGLHVRSVHELDRALKHIVDKMNEPSGTSEGAIALEWADDALPEEILGEMLKLLNRDDSRQPWRSAATTLSRITLLRYDPEHADAIAVFVREGEQWYAAQGPFMRQDDILPPSADKDHVNPFGTLDVEALAREFSAMSVGLQFDPQRRAPGHGKHRRV